MQQQQLLISKPNSKNKIYCTLRVSPPKFKKLSCCNEFVNELTLDDKALLRAAVFGKHTLPKTFVAE